MPSVLTKMQLKFAANIAEAVRRGGLTGGAPEGDAPAPAAPPADDKATKLEAELVATRERAAKLEADAKKRDDDAKKAADDKAVANGKAAELLAQREAELASERARLATLEKREKDQAEALFDSLSDAEKESAKVLKDKLSVSDWHDYMRTRQTGKPGVGAPPPSPASGRPGSGVKPRHKISEDTKELLDSTFAPETAYAMAEHLDTHQIDAAGNKKFTINMDRFLRGIQRLSKMPSRDIDAIHKAFQ